MHGFLRGYRQKFIIAILFILSTIIFTSCSVFRTLGLYNVPPPYSDSYEEFHGKPLQHLNKAENISMYLSSDKESYYPGEPITISCIMINHSKTDTMGVNSPFAFKSPNIRILNSSGKRVDYHGNDIEVFACPVAIAYDEFGRQLNVSSQKQIPPNSKIEFTIRIDRNYYNNSYKIWSKSQVGEILERAYKLNIRELAPDIYTLTCYANHTVFDEIEGPQNVWLNSDTLNIEIMKPGDSQINQKEEYTQIIRAIMELDSLDNIFKLGKTYENNYPQGIYMEKIKRIVLDKENLSSLLSYLKKYKEKEAQ
jgi:hypothetical protein